MAHHPIFESDPPSRESYGSASNAKKAEAAPFDRAAQFDLAELAAKFSLHSGGRLSAELTADLALDVVLNEIVEQACLATGATGAAIVLERAGEWVCRASSGENAPQLGARLDTDSGLSGACVKTRTVQRCDDAQSDPRADIEACRQLGVRSVIILPLVTGNQLLGVFEAFSPRMAAFRERDERTIEALSQRVLKNLQRASVPLIASPEPPKNISMAELILADLSGESISTDSVSSDTASHNKVQAQQVQDAEPDSRRAVEFITWALGVTILAGAVLLALMSAQRLSTRRIRVHVRAPAVVEAGTATGQPAGKGDQANAALTAAEEPPQFGGSNKGAFSENPSVSAAPHTSSTVPPGGLLVFEKGKEIFRLPSPQTPAVQKASEVESAEASSSSNFAAGEILHRIEPVYPEEARQKQIEGAVVVDVNIDRDGKVLEVKTVSGSPLLADAVSDAVKQWIFKPHSVSGHLVPMQTRITLNFRLPH
jgi:TonB family protein